MCGLKGPGCGCLDGVTAFFEIMLKASQAVSSTKLASNHVGPDRAEGCLDKLILLSKVAVPRENLERRLAESGVTPRVCTLKDRKWYLLGRDGVQFYLGHPENTRIHKIITRPSAFVSWDAYIKHLKDLCGDAALSAKIQRIDLTVDYHTPFANMLRCLDVTHKRIRTEYQEHSGIKTGLLIGAGANKIVVYDKSKERGEQLDRSRIEIQLSGNAAPKVTIDDLPRALIVPEFRPFKSLRLSDVRIDVSAATHPEAVVHRMAEFETLWRHNGFYGARKALNGSRNFQRDVQQLLTLQRWSIEPDDVLRESLNRFFNQGVSR